MRAYQTIRFTEFPDVGDIQAQGRKSRVGRLDQRAYSHGVAKARTRRTMKRVDKAKSLKLELAAEGEKSDPTSLGMWWFQA